MNKALFVVLALMFLIAGAIGKIEPGSTLIGITLSIGFAFLIDAVEKQKNDQ
jgi:hypothetical protein